MKTLPKRNNTALIIVSAILLSNIFTAVFWNTYYVQIPWVITLRPLILPRKGQTKVESPKTKIFEPTKAPVKPLTDKELIMSKKNGAILWKVYGLESTWGKNDLCKRDGTVNGFGYGQNYSVWNCFDSLETVVNKVDAWFETKLKTYSLSESLCLYNSGNVTKSCDYYKNYLTLN